MNKIYNAYFDETYYTEQLDNGLKVIIFHKPLFDSSVCSFGTPYGALKIHEKLKNKEYHFNPGIAHFLEHKLFETKGDDIMAMFSSLGANVNAFTSYKETVYYFSKTGSDIKQCLNLLLDFVQNLNISEESVEKEKGIINQEISMYAQMPNQKLLNNTYKCLYYNYPLKYDIGGDKKSIYAISKEELELCYKINYHPCNMVLCITSPIDPKKIIKIVKDNQSKKKFVDIPRPQVMDASEPSNVKRKTMSFKADVACDKHCLAYKITPNFTSQLEAFKKEWCLRILCESIFSTLNPQYQKWIDQKIINDFFTYEVDFDLNYANILFFIENNDALALKKLVKENFNTKLINIEIIEQLKRRNIGIMFDSFNDIDEFNSGYIRDYLEGIDFFEAMECLKNISLDDITDTFNELDLSNYSYISMKKLIIK